MTPHQVLGQLPPGTEIEDRYELISLLACTHMSVVHKAWDHRWESGPVVLKFITYPGTSRIREEMKNAREIYLQLPGEYTAKLIGDGEINIHSGSILSKEEAATKEGVKVVPFQVMEFLEGITIKQWIEEGNIIPDIALKAILDILHIVETLHKLRWVHRDIKPSNFIRCQNGSIKIIDFGVSKHLDSLGHTEIISPGYTAPEALPNVENRGKPQWSFLSDIYSVAAVFMALLCGEEKTEENGPIVDRDLAISKVGPTLTDLICKSLDNDPSKRHESATKMLEEFDEAIRVYKERQDAVIKRLRPFGDGPHQPLTATDTRVMTIRTRLASLPDNHEQQVNGLIQIARLLGSNSGQLELNQREALVAEYREKVEPLVAGLMSQFGQQQQAVETEKLPLPGQTPEDTLPAIQEAAARFNQSIEQVKNCLSQLEELLPGDRRFVPLHQSFGTLAGRWNRVRTLAQLAEEMVARWQEAAAMEVIDPDRSIQLYGEAAVRIGGESQRPDWERTEKNLVALLQAFAQKRYDDVRYRFEMPITRREEEVADLVVELMQTPPDRNIVYFDSDQVDAIRKSMPARLALGQAQRRLVAFWRRKIGEYTANARQKLEAHQPREALAALHKWEELKYIFEVDRLGIGLPQDLKNQISEIEDAIRPELKRLEEAEESLQKSELEPDLLNAYSFWQRANDSFPYHNRLDQQKAKLVSQAEQESREWLRQTEQDLQAEDWVAAALRLQRLKQLLALSRQNESQYSQLQAILDRITPLTAQAGPVRLSGEAERQQLLDLQRDYPQYWSGWPRLAERLYQLEARRSVEDLRQQAIPLCQPDTTVEALQSLLNDTQTMLDHPPLPLTPGNRDELAKLMKQLKAWLGFALAREELDKADRAHQVTDISAYYMIDVADLQIVDDGLKAANQDVSTAKAARQLRLAERRRGLEGHDDDVRKGLDQTNTLLHGPPTLDNLRNAYRLLLTGLSQPTSHRAELLRRQEEVRTQLGKMLQFEAAHLVQTAQPYYEKLDGISLERLLQEYEQLYRVVLSPPGLKALQELTAGPIALHQAARLEAAVHLGNATWASVQQAWEAAHKLYQDRPDSNLAEYSLLRARQAYKEDQLQRARNESDFEVAEATLRILCQDPLLRHDWDVWFEHGHHCLETARTLLEINQTTLSHHHPQTYLTWARDSLNRARRSAEGKAILPEKIARRNRLPALIAEAEQWERLVQAQREIKKTLEATPITHLAIQQAAQQFEEAKNWLQATPVQQLFRQFWQEVQRETRTRLDKQINTTRDNLVKLDSSLALHTLFPNERLAQEQLVELAQTATRRVRSEVEELANDPSAATFAAEYRKEHQIEPPTERVAELQLAKAEQMEKRLANLQAALAAPQLAELEIYPSILDETKQKLTGWLKLLGELRDSLAIVRALTEDGLRVPQQFDRAAYVLLMSGDGTADMARVPTVFRDRAHPTYRWHAQQLATSRQRRESQEKFRAEIETLLASERATTMALREDELPALLAELPQKLELTLSRIQEMQRAEPHDICGLQENMIYTPPDEENMVYSSLEEIANAIRRKLNQYQLIQNWLAQFTIGWAPKAGQCPGIINWNEAHPHVLRLRDSGPQGLNFALRFCQEIREGVNGIYTGLWTTKTHRTVAPAWREGGPYSGLWPLGRAYHALSYEAMLAYWQKESGVSKSQLYTVTQLLNQQRVVLQKQIEQSLSEVGDIEEDIRDRQSRYNQTWELFIAAHNDLMSRRSPLLRGKKGWLETPEWNAWHAAAEKICQITPAYKAFHELIEQAYEKTGLRFICEHN